MYGIKQERASLLVKRLARRQLETAWHVAMGKGNKQIALAMGLSTKTVDAVLRIIRRKLEVSETYGIPLILFASGLERGWENPAWRRRSGQAPSDRQSEM